MKNRGTAIERKSLTESIAKLTPQIEALEAKRAVAEKRVEDTRQAFAGAEDPTERARLGRDRNEAVQELADTAEELGAAADLLRSKEAALAELNRADRAETLEAEAAQLAKANEAAGAELVKTLGQVGRLIAGADARNLRLRNITHQILDLRGLPAPTGFESLIPPAGTFDLDTIASSQRFGGPGARVERVMVSVPPPTASGAENGGRS